MKTTLRLAPLALLIGCASPGAFASFDFVCSPTWAIAGDQLQGCSNLPFLSPGNDSRANLQLLLADAGRLRLPETLKSTSGYEDGYAQVPFTLEMLDPAVAEAAEREKASEGQENDTENTEAEQEDPRKENLSLALEQLGVELGDTDLAEHYFAEGEGNRCRSNDFDSAHAFVDQLAGTEALSAGERKALADSRVNLLTVCGEGDPQPEDVLPAATLLTSPVAQAFATYLAGADAFYRGDFAGARQQFTSLASSEQPWLRETALYMQARVALNQAQQDAFDEYGIPDLAKIDRNAMASAESGLKAYLQAYPEGLYHASARGLLRKVYWLLDDPRKFAAEYAWQFAQDEDSAHRNMSGRALIEELDVKLLPALKPEDVQDPTLLAVMDLIRLRKPGSELSPSISLEQLQAQKQRFASQPGLHDYLVAAWHFYRGGDAAKALAALPAGDTQAPMGLLAFSQETLRGLALEATGKPDAARELWLQLLSRQPSALQRGQLELALALNLSRTGKVAEIFAADSPIRTAPIREIVLRNLASADLLRQQAKDGTAPAAERDTALFTLLYKELVFGDYAHFQQDLALLPNPAPKVEEGATWAVGRFAWAGQSGAGEYACPSLAKVTGRLQENDGDGLALNCLGDFIRTNGLDGFSLNDQPPKDELGGSTTDFPGSPWSRLAGYQRTIDDPHASADEMAYALFRAVNCFAPAGYNTCDGQDIAKSQRKQWFQDLKKNYPGNPWAQKLKYYW